MKRTIVLFIVGILSVAGARGQISLNGKALIIGELSPELSFQNVDHFRASTFSLSDLKGQYVILDFWSLGCASCFDGFKKLEALRKKFEGRIQLLAVAKSRLKTPELTQARSVFEKYRERWGLGFPVAYDEEATRAFGIPYFPLYLWIDKAGRVVAITSPLEVNESNLNMFLEGRSIHMNVDLKAPEVEFNPSMPLLMNGNGGSDSIFLFRSVLAAWDRKSPMHAFEFISSLVSPKGRPLHEGKNKIQFNGVSLKQLIEAAYGDTIQHGPPQYITSTPYAAKIWTNSSYGNFWREPILELNDSSQFDFDWTTGRNGYSYSLIIPESKGTAAELRRWMQKDLSLYFNYDISIETRMMPCWNLTAGPEALRDLPTKKAAMDLSRGFDRIKIVNMPLYQLIAFVNQMCPIRIPIIDRTGIEGNIDIEIQGALRDFDSLRNALEQKGLHLTKDKKEMKVIVVREKRS